MGNSHGMTTSTNGGCSQQPDGNEVEGRKKAKLRMKLLSLKRRKKEHNKTRPASSSDDLKKNCEDNHVLVNNAYLSPEEIRDIQDTFPYVTMHLHEILNEAFIHMFTLNPDIKEKFFAFKDSTIEDLRKQNDESRALQRHIPRVARALVKILSRVDNLDAVLDYLKILGKIHHQNGIQKYEMLVIGPHFIASAVRYLPSTLRDRNIQESWLRFFTVIMQLMSKGYPETLIELKLSVEEKVLLKTTLRQLKKEQNKPEGMVHLINLRLDLNTEDYCDLDRNLVPRHADFLFKILDDVSPLLDNPSSLEVFLVNRGRNQAIVEGIQKQYLDALAPILADVISPSMEAQYGNGQHIHSLWLRFLRLVVFCVEKGIQEVDNKRKKSPLMVSKLCKNKASAAAPRLSLPTNDLSSVKPTTSELQLSPPQPANNVRNKTSLRSAERLDPDAIQTFEEATSKRNSSDNALNVAKRGSHDYLNCPEMVLARTLRARSTSTGSLLAQKLESLKKSSEQELLTAALSEVSDESNFYEGKMLKKFQQQPHSSFSSKSRQKRSKSVDVGIHYKVVK